MLESGQADDDFWFGHISPQGLKLEWENCTMKNYMKNGLSLASVLMAHFADVAAGKSQVVAGAVSPAGGAVRKVLAGSQSFTLGVIHKDKAKRGSGRPAGSIEFVFDDEGNRIGYSMFTPEFSPNEGELGTLSESGETRTLSSSGGYIKHDGENVVVFDAEGNALGQLKWQARVSLIPMDTITKRKAEAAARRKAQLAAKK